MDGDYFVVVIYGLRESKNVRQVVKKKDITSNIVTPFLYPPRLDVSWCIHDSLTHTHTPSHSWSPKLRPLPTH